MIKKLIFFSKLIQSVVMKMGLDVFSPSFMARVVFLFVLEDVTLPVSAVLHYKRLAQRLKP